MKIILAQLNPVVGCIQGNKEKILETLESSKKQLGDIVLFSELILCGYPPEDLLLIPAFIDEMESSLQDIVKATSGITAVVGTVRKNRSGSGKPLFNTAAILSNKKIIGYQDKILLPTYDVFDERRYFEPGKTQNVWVINGKKIAITICEDIWQITEPKEELSDSLYPQNPIEQLKSFKPDVVLNLSSSPFCTTHFKNRLRVCERASIETKAPFFYCNQVGANDSLVFDGHSLCFDENGQLMALAKGFEEDILSVDLPFATKPLTIKQEKLSDIYQALILGVKDYFKKSGFKRAVLGVSGGIDSALVACIAVEALGKENVLGIAMPSRFSSKSSLIDARKLSHNLGFELKEISIESVFETYLHLLEPDFKGSKFDITEENLQARIRGMILMAFSNKYGSIVLSTGNKSEMALGYCTLYGDMCGGIAVISDVTKTEVYEISKWLNRSTEIIPFDTIIKAPSAELKLNQTDQDTLPNYEVIDKVIAGYLEEHLSVSQISEKFNFPLNIVDELIQRLNSNEYKRKQAPPGLRISESSLTAGRRFPIVQRWMR
jgi:NAD+ synthase (glutamine-hydrolysing)